MSWPGLKLNFYKNNGVFNLSVCDHRETGTSILLNSASGVWNVGNNINIYDGNTRIIMAAWSMNDGNSIGPFSSYPNTNKFLRNGILVVDNIIYPNTISLNGKNTPLNFSYDEFGHSTFLAIGGELQNQNSSSSILSYIDVANTFNGIIQDIVIWDRVLTSSINSDYYQSMNGPWKNFYDGEDPLTGANLKAFSANVVAYYKFKDDSLLGSSLTAKDYAGSNNNGSQTNPASGNTLSLFDSSFATNNSYTIIDNSLIGSDYINSSGKLQFQDENGVTQNIGKIFYDLGIIVFDNEYNNSSSGFPILTNLSVSGMTLDRTLTSNNYYINYINFIASETIERLTLNLNSTGDMMNITENPTGIDITTGKQILNTDAGYITAVGLYNDFNELIAISKLNKPIRKDSDHNININPRLDF